MASKSLSETLSDEGCDRKITCKLGWQGLTVDRTHRRRGARQARFLSRGGEGEAAEQRATAKAVSYPDKSLEVVRSDGGSGQAVVTCSESCWWAPGQCWWPLSGWLYTQYCALHRGGRLAEPPTLSPGFQTRSALSCTAKGGQRVSR